MASTPSGLWYPDGTTPMSIIQIIKTAQLSVEGRALANHAEFTATVSIVNGVQASIGTLTADTAHTTNSAMITSPSAGVIRFAAAGVYSMTIAANLTATASGESFVGFSTPSGLIVRSHVTANDRVSATCPDVVAAAATTISFDLLQTTGSTRTVLSRLSITRL